MNTSPAAAARNAVPAPPSSGAGAAQRTGVCGRCGETGRPGTPERKAADGSGPGGWTRPESGRFRARRVSGSLYPRTPEEVADIVRATAARAADGTHTPLHLVSTGRNWGLGSASPVRDGVTVLNLSALDRIREVDTTRGYAVVEPGVTHGALADRLAGSARIVNLTGASQHTSVVGNILERGVGLHRVRADDLAGLELVLADGTFARTGWWPQDEGSAAVQPHGRGPSLNHLFTQSGLAAVTAAVVRLPARPQAVRVLPLVFTDDRLAAAVDTVREWTAQGLAPATTKIYNPLAAGTYGVRGAWLAHICLTGDAELVRVRERLVAERAAVPGSPFTIAPAHAADTYVHRAYAGDPDPEDTLFIRKTGHCASCLDNARGLLMFLPIVPLDGQAVRHAAEMIQNCLHGRTAPPGVTMNILDSDTVDHVVTLAFDPGTRDAVRDAHRTLDQLHTAFGAEGYHPYRPDIDHPFRPSATALHRRLGEALDPHEVFASGRY
ncbi:FAD-binding oxidoreductase [Streptomyces sp. NPDC058685]|uniref:FAD-binding oxidoreductase n=1 Tax=Streptomyces sp. NPDC058685 TaxID=3346598 RepID=UPI00365F4FFE